MLLHANTGTVLRSPIVGDGEGEGMLSCSGLT